MTEQDIINNADYRLTVTKTWCASVKVWRIQFHSLSQQTTMTEFFVTEQELQRLQAAIA